MNWDTFKENLWMASALLLVIAGCAHTDEWTGADTKRQVVVGVVMLGDAITTSRIQDTPHLVEVGPIASWALGSNPSDVDVALYFGSIYITSYFIARALPESWRKYYQVAVITDHAIAVRHNCLSDLC